MNQNVYRLVFNKIRGFVMAVAECASSRYKSAGDTPSSRKSGRASRFVLNPGYISLMAGLGLLTFVMPLQAQVVAYKNAPGNQQPTILSGQNGVPIVNIQTPSAAGVSRNVYSQFDVDANGVVMNNSRTNTQTQLSGWVQGNPWLAGGTAKIILNEVNASNPSLLNGFIEIGGDKAQFVLANPAGISCTGCGFINANRVTLTTGTPIMNGGHLDGYRVQNGVISITGNGMSADQAGYTDLIARAVEVNAGIWANQLNITTGVNVVNAANTQATQAQATDVPPQFAIDVAQLGGMYANKIILVGTEAGVGVRNMGTMGASVGEVTITADGKLENSGRIIGTQAIRINTQQITNTGMIATQSQLDLNTRGILDNSLSGQIIAGGNAQINADTINNNQGEMTAGGTLSLTAADAILNADGQIVANGQVNLQANHVDNTAGQIASVLGGININAANTISSVGGRIESTALTSLTSQQTDNTDGLIAGVSVNINTGTLENTRGHLLSDAAMILQATNATNNSGLIRAGGQLTISVDTLTNTQTRANEQGIEGESVTINAGTIDNTSGAIRANDQLEIISHGSIVNQQGQISSVDTLSIHDTQANRALTLSNTDGTLLAGSQLFVETASLSGNGKLLSQGNLTLDLTTDLTHSGSILANNDISLTAVGQLTNSGEIQAGNTLAISASALDNQASGEISAEDTQITVANTLNNRGLIDGEITTIESTALNNLGTGRIYGDYLSIGTTTLNNGAETVGGIEKAGVIAARDTLDIGAQTINNSGHGLTFSAGDLYIGGSLNEFGMATGSAQTLTNTGATIEALGSIDLKVQSINNLNAGFTTELVLQSSVHHVEYQHEGRTTRYDESEISFASHGDGIKFLWSPETWTMDEDMQGERFWKYDFDRKVSETVITATDPGKILAGGNLSVESQNVLNDMSQIIAGGTIDGDIDTLNNTEIAGERKIEDIGDAIFHYRRRQSGNDDEIWERHDYAETRIESITLTPTIYQQHASVQGSGTQLADASQSSVDDVPTGTASVIRTNPSAPQIPTSSLLKVHPESTSNYLIETDQRFANYRQWLGSDYMLNQLSYDPAMTQKRLGDGFYEQRLINEQIAQLTGRRFLDGYSDQETQYLALMNAGLTFAQGLELVPGVALSAEQVAQLTSDIVWLVEQNVTLPDGSSQKVLVPQVYVRLQEGDLLTGGALLAGNNVNLNIKNDLTNSGTIAGRGVVALTAENINNLGGRIEANTALLSATTDLINRGGSIRATDTLIAEAGRDLSIESTTRTQTNAQGHVTNIDRVAGLYVTGEGGTLIASAGNDLTLLAGLVQNSGQNGQTSLIAGNNLTLDTVTENRTQNLVTNKDNWRKDSMSRDTGSAILTQGDLTLAAGNDITARGATVNSTEGNLSLTAGRDIQIGVGELHQSVDEAHKHKDKGTFSSTVVTQRHSLDETLALSSSFGGQTVQMQAGNNLTVTGSQVLSDQGTFLSAGNNLTIEAARETRLEDHLVDKKKSGIFSSGGFGFTIGKQQLTVDKDGVIQTALASTVGAIDGDVTLIAGKNYTQTGSHVMAPGGNITVAAENIAIQEAREAAAQKTETRFKQTGLTIAISNPVVSAIQTAEKMSQAAGNTSDGRMKAIAAANIAMSASNAYDAVKNGQDPVPTGNKNDDGSPEMRDSNAAEKAGGINISVSLGTSKSQSNSQYNSNTGTGSTLSAGGDITLLATGGGKDSNILIQGSDVTAGKNLTLAAENELLVLASRNESQERSTNKSSSASVGVSFGTSGFYINAGGSKGKGHGNGDDLWWNNSHLTAGDTLTLVSGGDTSLIGAVAKGNQIVADIGGDLRIESLQDQSTYDGKQQNIGGSISVGFGNKGYVSGSLSYDQSKVNSNYLNVAEQSGLKAGDGGFDVKVKGDTDLIGGVIASTDKAVEENKNRFETGGELAMVDLENKAHYEAESISVNVGTSANFTGGFKPSGSGVGIGSDEGDASSTTQSGISGIAGNKEVRSDDAETGIGKIFDKEKVLNEIEAQKQITQLFGQLAPEAVADFANGQKNALEEQLRNETDPDKRAVLSAEIQKWDEGGAYRIAMHTAVGGLYGGIEGALGAGSAALFADKLGELQNAITKGLSEAGAGDTLSDLAGKLISQGAAAGIGAIASGGSSAGAGMGLNIEANNRQLHPDEMKWIKENAKRFAEQEGITEQEAIERLAQQGMKEVDYLWRAILSDGDDANAKSFIQTSGQKFINDLGDKQEFFTNSGQQIFRPEMYAELSDPDFYKKYVQSGISRTLGDGLWKEMKDSGINITEDVMQLASAIKNSPSIVLDVLSKVIKDLPENVVDGFIDTGHALGEGAAVTLNDDIAKQLNDIYGVDVSTVQKELLAIRTAVAIVGALGTAQTAKASGKVASEVGEKLNKIKGDVAIKLGKELDELASEALLKSGGVHSMDGTSLLDIKKLTNEQKSFFGDLFGQDTVQKIVPDGQKIARVPIYGETGLDDLYKVSRTDVDYVVIEYKFVGSDTAKGSSRLGQTLDGKQGSLSWELGGGRIEKAVGDTIATDVYDAIKAGRTETWVVTTHPNGSTRIEVLDALGKPKNIDTSNILPSASGISGARP